MIDIDKRTAMKFGKLQRSPSFIRHPRDPSSEIEPCRLCHDGDCGVVASSSQHFRHEFFAVKRDLAVFF
jgi:hypothetical protein